MNEYYQTQNLRAYPIVQDADVVENSRRMAETTLVAAEQVAFADRLRSALAKQALDNTAMLVSAAEQCCQIAPSGQEEYRYIIRAYARSAVMQMFGGGYYE